MKQSLYPLFAAAFLPLAGCAEPKATPAGQPESKSSAETQQFDSAVAIAQTQSTAAEPNYELATGTVYYSGDPQRGHKPDGTFRRGTKVSLLHRAGVYSVVRSQDGIEAYVATHTLAPLDVQ